MWEHIGTIAVIAGFILHFLATLIGGISALSQLKASVLEAISDHSKETETKFAIMRHETGEMGAALRQKITDVEIWGRDNFVRREGFYKVKEDLTQSIKELGDNIESRLVRMETKIDSKT